ncbi:MULTISPECIES: hypothetical protein [unclassified Streptomyces]|uniref:hypothetical protein n=1 Tax=unclassified Streptomyces TaxID=2593676 RepID=UPI00093D90D5|nr:hypothetical protein [Streptomyces sp. TSRI0281]OKI32137.1 hypothetical protein A6A29_21560 [Streptomyces sp. TSRI0281]
MSFQRRIAAGATTLALAGASLVGLAIPASAAPPTIQDCYHEYVQGSLGHLGAAVTCQGGSNDWFYGSVRCQRFDNGDQYDHHGPIVRAGQTSTAWCDYNAKVAEVWYTPA